MPTNDHHENEHGVLGESSRCEGCAGTGALPGRMQKLIQGHRICFDIQLACPICRGSGNATHEELMKFLETFGEMDEEIRQHRSLGKDE